MTAIPSRPWAEWPGDGALQLRGVLTDIDDTLTADGRITPDALDALARLRAAGLPVVAITGRPMGWSEPFVRPGADAWPIDAIVAENGGVALFPRGADLAVEYADDAPTRARQSERLRAAEARVLRDVPGATLARDSAGRVTDIAVDHSEHATLTPAQVDAVVASMRAEGLHATVSSIHVNGWLGRHTKRTGAAWAVRRLFERDLEAERGRWIYVGDSTNDQAMFASFPLSVGVANLLDFADALTVWPAYVTSRPRGAGFAEVAARLIAARAAAAAA